MKALETRCNAFSQQADQMTDIKVHTFGSDFHGSGKKGEIRRLGVAISLHSLQELLYNLFSPQEGVEDQ